MVLPLGRGSGQSVPYLPLHCLKKLSQIAQNETDSGTVLHSPSFKTGVTALPYITEMFRKLKTLEHFEI